MVVSAVACASSDQDNSGGNAPAATTKAAIPEVSLITITGDNDANNMIGRNTGYVAATVIVDPHAGEECDQKKPSIVCGAGVEQSPDAAAAQ